MRPDLRLSRLARVAVAFIALAGAIGTASADDLPDYMKPIAGHPHLRAGRKRNKKRAGAQFQHV